MADFIYPIELQSVTFTNTSILAIPTHTPSVELKKTNREVINNISLELLNQETHEWAVSMTSQFNKEGSPEEPYMIDMAAIGTFKVLNLDLPEDELMKALTITGHSIVYGAIRESVLWITSRSIFGPFTLGISLLKPQSKAPEEQKN